MKPPKLNIAPRSIWTNPLHFVASAFGAGASPIMPGTCATLLSIPFIILLAKTSFLFYVAVVIACNVIGIGLTEKMNHDLGSEDHPAAAWDEFAAFPIVFIGLPISWPYLLTGFIIFRALDIIKPFPISWFDKNIHGGLGAMLDDVIAALFTLIVLHIGHAIL